MIDAPDVERLQAELQDRRLDWCVCGGWGIDALLAVQTRAHKDLDVLVERVAYLAVREVLASHGFAVTEVWAESRELDGAGSDPEQLRQSAVLLTDERGREVDIHVYAQREREVDLLWDTTFRFTSADLAWPGQIGSTAVRCLSPARHLELKAGHELSAVQRADLDALHAFLAEA